MIQSENALSFVLSIFKMFKKENKDKNTILRKMLSYLNLLD